jgi:hypothetical protein
MFEFTLSFKGTGNYICPPHAGLAWRAAYEAGCDMEELEASLKLTAEERLNVLHKKRNEWFEFELFLEKLQRGSDFIRKEKWQS